MDGWIKWVINKQAIHSPIRLTIRSIIHLTRRPSHTTHPSSDPSTTHQFPIPEKRRKRLAQEFTEIDRNIRRNR